MGRTRSCWASIVLVIACLMSGCRASPRGVLVTITSVFPILTPSVAAVSTPPIEENTLPSNAPSGIKWLVHVIAIPDWPGRFYTPSWEDDITLRADSGPGEFVKYEIQPNTIQEIREIPKPSPFHNLPDDRLFYSPHGQFLLACDGKAIDLVRVANDEILGQMINDRSECSLIVSWTADDSTAAIIFLHAITPDTSSRFTWQTSNTQPHPVGTLQGPIPYGLPSWSPDRSKLAIPTTATTNNPEDQFSYAIVYTDGRPPKILHVGIGPTDEIDWLTDGILFPQSVHGCIYYVYNMADTGNFLDQMTWYYCRYAQAARLSPDRHWMVVDKTDDSVMFTIDPVEYRYQVFDLQKGNTADISTSTSVLINFVGWSTDSSQFYLVPSWRQGITPMPGDPPPGLLSLDPNSLQFKQLNPRMLYAWLSPNADRFFGLVRSGENTTAGFYALDGSELSSPIPIVIDPRPTDIAASPLPLFAWSQDGSQAAYVDASRRLWIARSDGVPILLGEGMPLETFASPPSGPGDRLLWSPNDELLFLLANGSAWVIPVPR